MADNPPKRVAHVVRIYQDNDVTSDVWADVERIDKLPIETGKGFKYRKLIYSYDWSEHFEFDDPTAPLDPDFVEYKKVRPPDSDPNDDSTVIKIPIRKKSRMESGKGFDYQETVYTHENGADGEAGDERKVHTRRVYHYDLSDGAVDEKGQPPRDPKDYLDAVQASSKDESQYVDVELLESFRTKSGKGYTYQETVWTLNSSSDPTDPEADPLLVDPLVPVPET
jgi:hypothetical protein